MNYLTAPTTITRAAEGAPPGTFVYTGRKEMDEVHVHLTHYDAENFHCTTSVGKIPEDNGMNFATMPGLKSPYGYYIL